ncbi:MAG: glycosyltransferase, partial [Candidatus Cloacimonetes bacterium]|nr:glycosyltransferase [Candidatus Cloacimonadota bacterium]
MKVLILSHNYPNSAQVAKGKFVSEQVRFLAKNCEIKVISPVPYAPPIKFFKKWYFLRSIAKVEIYEGIEVFHPRYILFPKKILFNFAGYFMYFGIHKTVKTLLNSWDCDIVHAHFSFPDGFAGMKIAQKFKKIFIITEHFGAFNEMIKNRFLKKSTRMVFEESKKVFVVSSDLKKSIESMNIDVSKIYELPNGVDVNKFICSNVKLELKFKIIAIGNFVPVKGF